MAQLRLKTKKAEILEPKGFRPSYFLYKDVFFSILYCKFQEEIRKSHVFPFKTAL